MGVLTLLMVASITRAAPPATASADDCPDCDPGPAYKLPVAATTAPAAVAAVADTKNMAWIPAGTFTMGRDDDQFADARPAHAVYVDGFWMDRTDVTNAEFEQFVRATGYVTLAERRPDPAANPGVPAELLVPGGLVFTPPTTPVPLDNPAGWWRFVPGASWRHPEGPGSEITGLELFPVVQIAFADAAAYAARAGKRLPTEAEWERAARGGLDRQPFAWGDQLRPGGRWMANTYQGHFPDGDTAADGHRGVSPVGSYPANGYGLLDMSGNVWQWCADWYAPNAYTSSRDAGAMTGGVAIYPVTTQPSKQPTAAAPSSAASERSMRGGSYLCTEAYCGRFAVAGRGHGDPDTPLNHVGFRCVFSPR